MKAAVHTRYGPPSVVRISEVEKPTAQPNEMLIKVHATTVNRTDCAYRSGKPFPARIVYGLGKPRATILGNEFAGQVEAIGSSVRRFHVGDRVFGYIEGRFGGHAEYLVIPEDGSVASMPANITYEAVAPSTEGFHYALSMITAARIRPGHTVLVNGATGGIGSAAVQLLSGLGARVTAADLTKGGAAACGAGRKSMAEWLRVAEVQSDTLHRLLPALRDVPARLLDQAIQDHRYAPYVERQHHEVARLHADRSAPIARDFDYARVPGLSNEMVERLSASRPSDLGEASRIRGVTPAALAAILVAVSRKAA